MKFSRQDNYAYEIPHQNFGFDAEITHAQQQKPRRRFGCCCGGCALGCLGFILLIALGLGFIGFNLFGESVPLSISPETTIITEPLKSDGKTIDYHQAIQDMIKPERAPNDNGFRDLLIGFGTQVFDFRFYDDPEQTYRLMCEELDIDSEVPPTFSLPQKKANDLVRWVEAVSPGLDAVQTALTKLLCSFA